tara:strand:+ start:641 stop:928 length:288 start_codon:yes stop_codon:yes gene_type:complete
MNKYEVTNTHPDDMYTTDEVWIHYIFLDGVQNFWTNSECGKYWNLTEDEAEATRMTAHHANEASQCVVADLSDDPHYATFDIGVRYSPAVVRSNA